MKVLFTKNKVYPFHPYGGSEKFVYYLIKHLCHLGVEAEVITANYPDQNFHTQTFEGVKYTFIEYPNIGIPGGIASCIEDYIFASRVSNILKNEEFDILHSFDWTSLFYLRMKNRKPVVLNVYRDTYQFFIEFPEIFSRLSLQRKVHELMKRPMRRWIILRTLKYCWFNAELLTSEGEFQTEEMVKDFGLDRGKIFDISVGVDIAAIDLANKDQTLSREELGIGKRDLVLITVNRLEKEKGIDYLVDALKIVKKEIENIKLIIVGVGLEEKALMNQVQRLGLSQSVFHFRNVEEKTLYNLYKLSDIYVSPTFNNDFIMGILEAMVCRLPIVSTNQEWLVRAEENGLIVPKRAPYAIAEAVLEICKKNLGGEMGKKSRQLVMDYDWKEIARKTIREYEKLLLKGIGHRA